MKTLLLTLFVSCVFLAGNAQELFFDKSSNDTCLFIGGICPESGKALKVFANGKATYRNPKYLTQIGLLIGEEFTDELFRRGLSFELSGYEPHCKVNIFKNTLTVWTPEYDSPKQYKVNLHIGKDMSSVFFAMFSTECGSVSGTINNIGLTLKEKCRVCEYNLENPSLYEAYINIEGKVYKGCGNICPISDKLFLQQFPSLELPYSNTNLSHILLEDDGRDTFDKTLLDSLKINPVGSYNVLPDDVNYYPVGKITGTDYTIFLTMHQWLEAGAIDPVIMAWLWDNKAQKITDSLKVYQHYNWEESFVKQRFEITADTLLIVGKKEWILPYYPEEDEELMNRVIQSDKEMKYRIDCGNMHFVRDYENNGFYNNEWEQGQVKNHMRDGEWKEIELPYLVETGYSDGVPVTERKYYKLGWYFDRNGLAIQSSYKKGSLLFTRTNQGEIIYPQSPNGWEEFVSDLRGSPPGQLPVGDTLLFFDFPSYWDVPISPRTDYQPTEVEACFNKLTGQLGDEYYSGMALKCELPKAVIMEFFRHTKEVLIDPSKLMDDSIVVYSYKLPCENGELYTVLFQANIDCDNCEYGQSIMIKIIISFHNGYIRDMLPVSYQVGNDLGQDIMLSYFAGDILYLKNFWADEQSVAYNSFQKYRLDGQGQFIRYQPINNSK